MAIRIVIDSGSDYTLEEATSKNITLLPLTVSFGEEAYKDVYELSHEAFFEKLIETDVLPTTSLISPGDYSDTFEKLTGEGHTVLCLTISSKLSGCYQSAVLAAEDYEGQVFVVDTENACIGQRILADRALELIEEGLDIEALVNRLNVEKKYIRLIAMLDTLEYLKKGGRISSTVAAVGSVLNIKPVIAIEDGLVKFLGVARGSKNVSNRLNELVAKEGGIASDKPCALVYSGLSDKLLQKYLKDSKALYEGKIDMPPVSSIGCAIGTHIGPGAIGVSFFSPKVNELSHF